MLEDRLMFDNAGKKKLKVGDLFAGVGGFSLGFMREGCELCWAVEWDKTCQKVLRRQHPHTKIFGDITKVAAEDLDDVDIIIGGSPCQDLSVAGKRKGLEGERSGLFHEFIRLVRAKSPRWVVWENVPGALSSNGGKDFGVVLGEMADSGYPDIAYRVLDARYFGVAQRRRRIFVVASREAVGGPTESRSARVLGLLEPIQAQQKSLRRHIEACRAQGQAPAPVAERSPEPAGEQDGGISAVNLGREESIFSEQKVKAITEAFSEGGQAQEVGKSKFFAEEGKGKWWDAGDESSSLTTRCHDQFMPDKGNFAAVIEHVPCQGFRYVNQQTGIVPTDEVGALRSCMGRAGVHEFNHPVIAQQSEDTMAFRLGQTGANGIGVSNDAYALDGSSPQGVMHPDTVEALAFQPRFFTRDQRTGSAESCSSDVVSPLTAGGLGDSANHVAISGQEIAQAYSIREDAKKNNFSATPLEVANALQAMQPAPTSHHAQTYIAQNEHYHQEIVGTLAARDYKGVGSQYVDEGKCIVQKEHNPALSYDGMNQKLSDEIHHSLRTGKDSSDCVISQSDVFRKSARAQTSTDDESWVPADHSNTLNAFDTGERDTHAVVRGDAESVSNKGGMVVRRLTPVECCVLMGWPHDWNEFGAEEDGRIVAISNAQRYKQCGNGVVSNCSQWIAAGILSLEGLSE